MKHHYSAVYGEVTIRPLERKDIENLRIWRNDASQTRFLRNIGHITREMQEKWYEGYLQDTDSIVFAIEETKRLKRMVGSLALYNFENGQAEIGRLQVGDLEARGHGIGGKSFVLAMAVGFKKLGLKRIYASVNRENLAAYKSYTKIGFQVCGSHASPVDGIEDEIEIEEKRWSDKTPYVHEITLFS